MLILQFLFVTASILESTFAFQLAGLRCKTVARLHMAQDERTARMLDQLSKVLKTESLSSPTPETSGEVSELPDSFDDAVKRAVRCTLQCISNGMSRVRIDFDTTVGDQTYTSLKSSLPMTKRFTSELCSAMELHPLNVHPGETEENQSLRSLRIFFPDMGAAALARRDWKMGSNDTEIPPCVYTANIQNDPVLETDKAVIILCPLYSEADYISRITDICIERNLPCIMINPNLINGDQGLGVRKYTPFFWISLKWCLGARNLKSKVINTFATAYKLKTMKKGAVVREWPSGYSVWNEDANSPDGYSLLQSYRSDPSMELLEELYEVPQTSIFNYLKFMYCVDRES